LNGTVTDFDGNYVLKNVIGTDVLQFSFVGYGNQEVPVNGLSVVNVVMTEDANQLDEVVVTGYVQQVRGEITGAVASVDMSEAVKVPTVNAGEALQGRVAGVTIIQSSTPGAAPKITIRGLGTVNNTNPLYIIDGVQTDDPNILNSISPTDIDQMNVLKDGAAAIYGSRAANGVIIVTTKSGGYNMDRAIMNVDVYSGLSRAGNGPEMMGTKDHSQMIWESLRNDGATLTHPQYGTGNSPVIPQRLNLPTRPGQITSVEQPDGTDWYDAITQTAPLTSVAFSLANGTNSGKYFFSANYLDREGILVNTGYERVGTQINSEFKVREKLRVGEHVNITYATQRDGIDEVIENSTRMSPLIPVRDDAGNFAGTYSNSAGLGNSRNPVAQNYRARDDYNKSLRVFGDIYMEYDFLKDLTFRTALGASMTANDNRFFNALDPEHGEPISTNTLGEFNGNDYNWIWTNTLRWKHSFGNHNFDALAGMEAVKNSGRGSEIQRTGYLFEDDDFYLLGNGSGTPLVTNAYDYDDRLFSIFGIVNYNWNNKFFLSATVRQDESSRFSGDNKTGIFPSFSAGWQVFQNEGVFSSLKLRGSWGELGNQNLPIGNPDINISVLNENNGNYAINGSAISGGAVLSSVGNPNIAWETSVTTNFGVDLGFFNNDLYMSIEYWIIDTDDFLTQDFSLLSTTAIDAAAPFVNIGSVRNTGIDFALGYHKTYDSSFKWGIDATVSAYKNEITSLKTGTLIGRTDLRGGAMTRSVEGRPISSFYGRVVEGIFQTEAEVAAHADQGFATPADGVGRFKYEDLDDNGVINDLDRDYIGSPHPDFTYGLNLMFGYGGFDLSAFFNGSQGNDLYNYNKIYSDFPTFFDANRSTRVNDSWRPDNTDASLPALSQSVQNGETSPNSFFVEDGSYFRLKNLQVGYTFDGDWTKKAHMDTFRIYAQGTNLFTITDYDGVDPEIAGNDNVSLGIDYRVYPYSQIFTLGVNVKF
jgi:TonB-linked SusC/RagA family outer membrane protein